MTINGHKCIMGSFWNMNGIFHSLLESGRSSFMIPGRNPRTKWRISQLRLSTGRYILGGMVIPFLVQYVVFMMLFMETN
jgi:hypothetical protein